MATRGEASPSRAPRPASVCEQRGTSRPRANALLNRSVGRVALELGLFGHDPGSVSSNFADFAQLVRSWLNTGIAIAASLDPEKIQRRKRLTQERVTRQPKPMLENGRIDLAKIDAHF